MDLVLVALIGVVGIVVGPIILNQLNRREDQHKARVLAAHEDQLAENRRLEREQDWERQDRIADKAAAVAARAVEAAAAAAEKAAVAADQLVISNKEAVARTERVAELAAQGQELVRLQLAQIHGLVNSDMTAAREELLTQTKLLVTLLKRIIKADRAAGLQPMDQDLTDLQTVEDRVSVLEGILAERHKQQAKLDEQTIAALDTPALEDAVAANEKLEHDREWNL